MREAGAWERGKLELGNEEKQEKRGKRGNGLCVPNLELWNEGENSTSSLQSSCLGMR